MNLDCNHVMLVEDEIIIALHEKKELEKLGYMVTHVSNGEEAVRYALDNGASYDVILMDIDLGAGIDGTEAAKKILEARDLPIVFLTSHVEPSMVEKTEKITSYGYVVKNTGFIVLDASMKMALKLFKARMEEQRIRQELDRQKNLYEQILEQTLAGYWDWNIQSGEEYLSPTFKRMFGYEDNELENKPDTWQKLIFPEDLTDVFETFRQHAESRGKIPYYNEVRYRHKNGSTVWVICTGNIIEWDEQGAPRRMIGCHIDITKLKLAEEKIRESESKYRTIVENVTDALYIHDFEGRILDCNDAACAMTGYTRGELVGNSLSLIDSEENKRLLPERMNRLLDQNMIVFEGSHIRKDGSEVAIEICGKVVSREGNGLIQGFVRDISERKISDEMLRKSEEKYRTLIETTDTGFVFIDGTGCVLDANKEYVRLSGHTELSEILGRNVIEWTAESDRKKNADAVRFCFDNGYIRNFEVNYTDRNGRIIPIEINATTLKTSSGIQIITICRDITERKLLETEIQRQLAEKEVLLREVHHRIKNNIANIKGLLLLQVNSTKSPEVKSALQNAITRIQSVNLLYEKLLSTDAYEDVSVKTYVDDLIDAIMSAGVGDRSISIERHVKDFFLDSKKAMSLGIILNELLTNALKHAFIDCKNGTIAITVGMSEGNVVIVVQDNGLGIQVRDSVDRTSGLGLSLVKMLAEQLKGTCSITNENGTRVAIEFTVMSK